jgi:hypothetical protein
MLAHMLNGDLADARHAHRRLAADTAAASATALADQQAAMRVLRRLWPGDGGPATAAAASTTPAAQLHEQTVFAALAGHAWPAGATAAVAAALGLRLRRRALADAACCYSRLPLREASLLFGYGADEAAALAAARAAGWRVVTGGQAEETVVVLEPPPVSGAAAGGGGDDDEAGGLPQLDAGALRRLTEYVAHLEADGFGGLLAGQGGGGAGAAGAAAAATAAGG